MLAVVFASFSVQAHEPPVSQYRVNQLSAPAGLNAGCVSGYSTTESITRINDLGVVNAAANCFTTVDPAHSVGAVDINDLGEIAGLIAENSQPDFFSPCDPRVAVRWERDGRERLLPHLPGAVSSQPFGVGGRGSVLPVHRQQPGARGAVERRPGLRFDPAAGTTTIMTVACHNQRMFVLTPAGR